MRPTSPKTSAGSPSPTFTADDLVTSLARFLSVPANEDGLTSQDLRDQTGLSIEKVRLALREAHRAGRLIATKAYRESIDGKMRPTTVYRLKAA